MATEIEEQEGEIFEAPVTLSQRLSQMFAPRASGEPDLPEPTLDNPLDDEGRQAYIKGISPVERRWVKIALYLALSGGVIVTLYVATKRPTTTDTVKLVGGLPWSIGTKSRKVPLSETVTYVSVAVIVLSVIGLLGLRNRKRSIVIFSLFLLGLAFTQLVPVFGLGFLFVGGWLLLRAWRVQRHGVASGKAAATASAHKRAELKGKGSGTKVTTRSSATKPTPRATGRKPAPQKADRRPPTASKRYTPKAAPRKRIEKPT